jgi:transposase
VEQSYKSKVFCGYSIKYNAGGSVMISVGIDVAKDKHHCFIFSSEGEVLADLFTIPNDMDGFRCLLQKFRSCFSSQDKIEVGLEAKGLPTYVLKPLHTNLLPEKSPPQKDEDRPC